MLRDGTGVGLRVDGDKVVTGRVAPDVASVGGTVAEDGRVGLAATHEAEVPVEVLWLNLPSVSGEVVQIGNLTGAGGFVVSVVALDHHRQTALTGLVAPGTIEDVVANEIPHNRCSVLQLYVVGIKLQLDGVRHDGTQTRTVLVDKGVDAQVGLLHFGHLVGGPLLNLLQGFGQVGRQQGVGAFRRRTGQRSVVSYGGAGLVGSCLVGRHGERVGGRHLYLVG